MRSTPSFRAAPTSEVFYWTSRWGQALWRNAEAVDLRLYIGGLRRGGGIAIAALKAAATKAAALQPICLALVLMTETLTLTRRPPQNR